MQDFQNYQYYDPSPIPPSDPWWKHKRVWQSLGLIVLGVLALVFSAVAAQNVLKNRKIAKQDVDLMSQVDAIQSQLGAGCEAGDTLCLELARADAARRLGLVEACQVLVGEGLIDCVSLIAIDKADPLVCDVLSGPERAACADTPYLLQAQAELSLTKCDAITATTTRAACETQVEAALVAAGKCAEAGIDEAVCAQAEQLAEAVASGSPEACGALNESEAYACKQAQDQADMDNDDLVALDERAFGTTDNVADTDADGLTDGDEVHVYTTDPTKVDTDDDGFSDGTEVESGYDPLK
ncbi:MAG: hypothetical protein JW384_03741 [Nitrosomonadaceae bacterium]|nr:hypothetical protein [Nitrosomonadaceae bacterium]